jgi:hypothetical protein
MKTRPLCYFGDGKPAKYPASSPRWCSQRCAAEWAANYLDTEDAETWHPCCGAWESDATHRCGR